MILYIIVFCLSFLMIHIAGAYKEKLFQDTDCEKRSFFAKTWSSKSAYFPKVDCKRNILPGDFWETIS